MHLNADCQMSDFDCQSNLSCQRDPTIHHSEGVACSAMVAHQQPLRE